MDETQMLILKIVRATEQRKIKWNYRDDDSSTVVIAIVGNVKVSLEYSYKCLKDDGRMWLVMESPGSHVSMTYLWDYKKEVKELCQAIVSSIRGDSYSDLLEELERLDEGEEV